MEGVFPLPVGRVCRGAVSSQENYMSITHGNYVFGTSASCKYIVDLITRIFKGFKNVLKFAKTCPLLYKWSGHPTGPHPLNPGAATADV